MLISLIFSFLYLAPKALLIGAAILPAAVLLVYVYRHDRIEKEPRKLLLTLVLLGIVATFLAVATESLGAIALAWFLPGGEDNPAYPIWMYFVVVALSEEGFKYLILRWRTWRSPEFNCRFDAVVYAVFVSLGFALWENIGYVMMYGVGAAIARAITAVPGHACFGVFMGAYYGLAKRSANRGETAVSRLWSFLALLVPTVIHGLYDYIAVNETESFSTTFVVFVLQAALEARRVYRLTKKQKRSLRQQASFFAVPAAFFIPRGSARSRLRRPRPFRRGARAGPALDPVHHLLQHQSHAVDAEDHGRPELSDVRAVAVPDRADPLRLDDHLPHDLQGHEELHRRHHQRRHRRHHDHHEHLHRVHLTHTAQRKADPKRDRPFRFWSCRADSNRRTASRGDAVRFIVKCFAFEVASSKRTS